jgi:DNA polymerase III epsilon subunit-like protein
MSKNIAIAIDVETGSANAQTTQICSIGAIAVDTAKLEILPNTEFYSLAKPEKPEEIEEEALKVNKLKMDDLMKAPSEKTVWTNFVDYLKRYKTSNTHWGNVPLIGYNHINFDLIIFDRMCVKYGQVDKNGEQNLYHRVDKYDMIDDIRKWLVRTGKIERAKFDIVREYMGMEPDAAHNALSDAKDAAKLFIRFTKLYRELSNRIPFQGAFADGRV